MSNERVDVLAVMNRLVGNARTMAGLSGDPRMREILVEGEQARSAVTELLAAAREASGTLGHAYHTVLTGLLAEDAHTAYQRLDAALENAGGAE